MMQTNNHKINDFDEVMDAMLGAPGTPESEQFRREAYAYCVSTSIHE